LGAANVKYQKPVLTVEQQVELQALRPGTTFDLVWRRYRFSRGMAGDARTTGGCGTGC
jgi:hypothetical protein